MSATDDDNPALVLRVWTAGGRVQLGTSMLTREQAAAVLLQVAEDVLAMDDWTTDWTDLRAD